MGTINVPFLKLWAKTPVIIQSIFLGFLISTLGVVMWAVIATKVPLPYSFIIMVVLLWFYWRYFSGHWKPNTTKELRKTNFRSTKLSTKTWIWGGLAATLIVLIEQSGLIVTFRLMEFPAERFTAAYSFLDSVPLWAGWLFIIMISAVAAICEEIGFRGYMQVPLEKRYGPLVSISIVSIVFTIVHLHQAWSGPILIHIFFISVLFGSIAYFSGSLIPGIFAHFIMDICNFSFWWTNIGWQFNKNTIYVTGLDNNFMFWVFIFISSIILFIYLLKILKKVIES